MARPPIVFTSDSSVSRDEMDELVESRHREAPKVLGGHWVDSRWEPWAHDAFYISWTRLAEYAWALLRCQLTRHQWNDSRYNLTGSPGEFRDCERCYRSERLKRDATLTWALRKRDEAPH